MDSGWDSLIPDTKEPQVRHLFDAWLVRIEQWPRLHMFWHQTAAHSGDVLPVTQGAQCHVLICGPLLTCGCQCVSCVHALSRIRPVLGQGLGHREASELSPFTHLHFTIGETEAQKEKWLAQALSCPTGPREFCVLGIPLPRELDQRILGGCEVMEDKNALLVPAP